MFGMLLYNIGIKRRERNNNPGRRGRWRPEIVYLPVLLLRWIFVPHGNKYLSRRKPHTNENIGHHHHAHHYHHIHNNHHQDYIQRIDSSFLEDGSSNIPLHNILHGQ